MRRTAALTASIATLLLCGACGGSNDERAVDVDLPTKEMSADDRAAVDAEANRIVREGFEGLLGGIGEIPGLWIGIWDPERGVYVHGYGKAVRDGRDADRDDFVRIASVTKTFVATVVLQLVDEGKLRLGDSVEQAAPALARRFPKLSERTIAQLLSMTSGLPNPAPHLGDPQRVVSPDEMIARALRDDIGPLGGAEYSNTNYFVLGRVAEEVSGRSIGDLVDERVAGPLGIDAALPPPDDSSLPEPASHGYATGPCWSRIHGADLQVDEGADVTSWSVSGAGAAGAMYVRFEDLGVWGASMFGNVLLSEPLARRRLTEGPVWYGLGIWKLGGPWVGHFGDIDGWASVVAHNPDSGTTVAVVVNTCNLGEALFSLALQLADG